MIGPYIPARRTTFIRDYTDAVIRLLCTACIVAFIVVAVEIVGRHVQ